MSAYSDYRCGAMSYDEYRAECEREDRRDRMREEQMQYEDACLERCRACEMWDDATDTCSIGEVITRCSI